MTDSKSSKLWKEYIRAQKALAAHIRANGGDIFVSIKILSNGLICGDHPNYRGKRAPTADCERCREVYADRVRRDEK